ncbi:MAG: hypothetical protein M3291_09775 [Actinomycetota bacterium]|nr:hypothetical protein [Actinomycetota bacterium]
MTRSVTCRYAWVLLAALTFVAVGCGGGTDVVEDAGGGAAGAPFDEEGDDVAVGAPITTPDFQVLAGADFEESLPEIKRMLAERCGGALCVDVAAVADDDPGGEPCQITGVPPEGSTVKRGSTVTFVIEEACDASPIHDGDDPPPDDDENGSSSEAPDPGESTAADPDEG